LRYFDKLDHNGETAVNLAMNQAATIKGFSEIVKVLEILCPESRSAGENCRVVGEGGMTGVLPAVFVHLRIGFWKFVCDSYDTIMPKLHLLASCYLGSSR
jgi:hypothetical protein